MAERTLGSGQPLQPIEDFPGATTSAVWLQVLVVAPHIDIACFAETPKDAACRLLIDGVLDLVSRSKKPIQELAWASIGNVLTAIQICEANDRGVLVPWNSWRHEFYKPMGTLHDADPGGFISAPEVGLHGNVHELDFSSLYPNIICTRNVSPDGIRCSCHSDRDDVPGLGYSICDARDYLVDVLQPIIDARDEIKAAIRREKERDDPDEDRLAEFDGRSGALKWTLVACFGYQGLAMRSSGASSATKRSTRSLGRFC
ncbi:hypothetical protein GCM10009021_21620 [Halarchaeum nitratireducens]|uniref:DNA-directed DNA polymerase n=1 Tax=Halarchaeum nitratireducens TaxID=489913 RepID=A0A830GCN0_9EURY|nr:hypothetical protein GCM10009021_21620 [Halarchaeum nitratireducens]